MINKENSDLWLHLARLKILVIAKDWWIRDSLIQYLESYGCTIRAFDNAREGEEVLSTETFDVIIADNKLSDIRGMDFFRHIRMSHPDPVKILIMATCDRDSYSEGTKLGIHRIIEKPFTTKTIDEALSQVFAEGGNINTDL